MTSLTIQNPLDASEIDVAAVPSDADVDTGYVALLVKSGDGSRLDGEQLGVSLTAEKARELARWLLECAADIDGKPQRHPL